MITRIHLLPLLVLGILFFSVALGTVHAQTTNVGTGGGTTNVGSGGGTTNTGTGGGTTNVGTGGGTTIVGTGAGNKENCGNGAGTLQNPLNNICDLPTLLKVILQAVIELGSIILVIMLVWVGFLFVMARGNPEEISKARGALVWTLIGGLILLGAQAIMEVIKATVEGLG